ncbi:MAG: type II toxin-antitoxin system PemK/MazF family toxin [Candidatus Dadabacteria bacterium]|nr:type II toxin-antitoxin system PemK/MazF family toxin [Candidatus Dadabacteria bacterium]
MVYKKQIKQYDLLLANLDPTVGKEIKKTRPVVIVSKNDMNKYLDTIVVCPLTTSLHPKWRSRIQISCKTEKAEIAVDQIRTISKIRIIRKIESLSAENAYLLRKLITEMYGESD